MLNCRISQNIQKVCNTHVSGIYDKIYLYDIDDIISVAFDGDTRLDSGKAISAINSLVPFYTWDVSDGEYTEENDGDDYSHELTSNIHKTQEIETILSDAKNSRFLVAFRLRSENVYRVIGWNLGAKLTYSLTVGEDGNYYSITFTDEGLYPAFEADRGIFEVKDKTYEPLYIPYFTLSSCETDSDGKNTGFRIASYVTKQNAAGEALDKNNKLCEYSGKPQCAYKYEGASSDGGYEILGTYNSTAIYNGTSVKQYDISHCPMSKSGSITVTPSSINVYAHGDKKYLTVTTNDNWVLSNNKSGVSFGATSGNGNSTISVGWDGTKTSSYTQTVTFTDQLTGGTADVVVNYYYVLIDDFYIGTQATDAGEIIGSFSTNGDTTPTITVTSSSKDITPTAKIEYGNNWVIKYDATKLPDDGVTFTITINSNGDEDTKTIILVKEETSPAWTLINWNCEFVDGERTGYKISEYRDMNSKSATYMQTKEEKELSDDCAKGGEDWQVIKAVCQTDENGNNTGFKIVTEMQMNAAYDTYGTTRTTTEYDTTTCPIDSSTAIWSIISTICETDAYGNTGYKTITEKDINPSSSTYEQTRTSTTYDETLCPLNTDAVWEVYSKVCQTVDGINNGWQIVTYQDMNPHSSSFGEYSTTVIQNEEDCPKPEDPTWETESYVCTVDEKGNNTGYVTITQKDVNEKSATYGQTRTVSEYNTTLCPIASTEPTWETLSYTCVVDSKGNNTGECNKYQKDTNQYSTTYKQTRTITVTDTELCPLSTEPQWEKSSESCVSDTYGQTGSETITYTDVNPNSSTYKSTKSETIYAPTVCVPNTDTYWELLTTECETTTESEAQWEETSVACETDTYGQTGNKIITYTDVNPDSPTYNHTKSETISDTTYCPINTEPYWIYIGGDECEITTTDETPQWEETSVACETDTYGQTGNKIITYTDVNPFSETFMTTKETIVSDTITCVPTTDSYWVNENEYCGYTKID